MAPQAQLEESANDLGSAGSGLDQKTDHLGVALPGGTPFLSAFFLKSEPYVHRPARKVVRQKKNRQENTENLADLEIGRDPLLVS